MPASIELAKTYGDDLAIIFIECQGLNPVQAESFAYGKKWMGTTAMWTTERPCRSGSRGLPNFVLLSAEGKVLLKGHTNSLKKQIEDLIKKEVSQAKKGPLGAPKSFKKIWGDFGKGKYAAACAALRKIESSEKKEAEAAKQTLEVFQGRIESRIQRTAWMIDNGYLPEAKEQVESLTKSVKGLEEFEASVKELGERLASPDLKAEWTAAKAFAKIEKAIHKNGLDDKMVKQLEKFRAKQEGTMAANRAAHLVNLAAESES